MNHEGMLLNSDTIWTKQAENCSLKLLVCILINELVSNPHNNRRRLFKDPWPPHVDKHRLLVDLYPPRSCRRLKWTAPYLFDLFYSALCVITFRLF